MQEGGKEANPRAGQSRDAAQRPTDPRSTARAKKPPAPSSHRSPRARTTQPEQAQPARASGRTCMAVGCSLARATRRASQYQRTDRRRDARAPLTRCSPPRAQPATPDKTRAPPPPALVPACVAACVCGDAQCRARDGEARRRCPPAWHVRESRAHDTPRGRKRGTQQPTPHHPACVYAGRLLPLPPERAPDERASPTCVMWPDSRVLLRLA